MVSLLLTRPSFGPSSLVSGGVLGTARILLPNGVFDSAKPWLADSLPAAWRERALAGLRKFPIAVPAATETGPRR